MEVPSSREGHPHLQPVADSGYPAGPCEGPGSKRSGKCPISFPGLAKAQLGSSPLCLEDRENMAANTEGPCGSRELGRKDRVWLGEHSEGQKRVPGTPSYQEVASQERLHGPRVLGVLLAPASAVGAPRRLACPGSSPWPTWASQSIAPKCGRQAQLCTSQVSLALRGAGCPCRRKRWVWWWPPGYLVFWRSSRSQVGSVWPILYSSLESSMLWSR